MNLVSLTLDGPFSLIFHSGVYSLLHPTCESPAAKVNDDLAKATFALKSLKKKTRGLLVSGELAGSALLGFSIFLRIMR